MSDFMRFARLECRKCGEPFKVQEWIEEWKRLSPEDRKFYSTKKAWNHAKDEA